MSGQYPTNINFKSFSITSNRPTLINQTLSGKKQVRQIGSQYFSFSVQMPAMKQEIYQLYFAFLDKQKSSFEDFTIAAPLDNLGLAKTETDILVNNNHVAGDATITIDGLTANQVGAFKAGDYIKFNGHSKVYMLQNDTNASGTGTATILISPPLVKALANNEVIITNKPQFTVYLETDALTSNTGSDGFFYISFDAREVIV